MPLLMEEDHDGNRIYIPDEIRCSWFNFDWGNCIKRPRHRGRHLVIGTGSNVYNYDTDEVIAELPLGALIEVPRYTRQDQTS